MTKPDALSLLQWVYVGRVLVATVVFVTAAFYFQAVPPSLILTLAIAAIAALVVSGVSAFYSHIRRRPPTPTFIYSQAMFDLALVTTVVHVTGGAESEFLPLYILVIGVASVLLPLASSLLVTSLASSLFIADVVIGFPSQLSVAVWLQIGVFVAVALTTGWLGSRVRVVGQEHEELKEEVKRLRLEADDILRNIGSGVITVDGNGHLAYANPSAERLLAFRAADYVGKPVMEFLEGRCEELAATIWTTQQQGKRAFRVEGLLEANGETLTVGMTTTALELDADSPPSVTAIFTDISDQKRIEELNRRAERLEAVAALSASLAHEIKNPLASIRSSVEQLAESVHAGEDEQFLGQLVIRESDRLSRILNEFLDFARVRVALSKPVDLGRVVKSAVEVVRQHPACGDQVEIDVNGSCPTVEGDEDLLHRVVVNLLLNAVQAGDGQVRIVVTVRDAQPGDLPSGVRVPERAVLLRIRDDGPGIPEELRDRLFDPFVTGRPGGSGLGLAIVQRAVMAHKGIILLESVPQHGTTFSILLPGGESREAGA